MTKANISEETKELLGCFLEENSPAPLVSTFLFYIQNKFKIQPVLFPKEKMIYQSAESAIRAVESEDKLWHQTEIKVTFGDQSVNDQTKKIYICPFSGKVFGDNTHPNPQDAIYDWVSKCPENTERSGGLRVKRFFVSEDPEMIKTYLNKEVRKKPITKTVYSSVLSGKLYNSKESVVKDFRKNYLKKLTLVEVQSQNKFTIEEAFLEFIQSQLVEEKITGFVEAMAQEPDFQPIVEQWLS